MPDLTPERLAELERLEESATGMVKRSQFIGALIGAAPDLIEAARENARLKRIEKAARLFVTRERIKGQFGECYCDLNRSDGIEDVCEWCELIVALEGKHAE